MTQTKIHLARTDDDGTETMTITRDGDEIRQVFSIDGTATSDTIAYSGSDPDVWLHDWLVDSRADGWTETAVIDTLPELVDALAALPGLDPLERARRAPRLIDDAKRVLAAVRAAAITEAVAGGMRQADVARTLGVSRNSVSVAARRARTDSEEQR